MTSMFKAPEPAPLLAVLPSGFEDFFQATPLTLVCSGLVLIAVALLLGRAWWLEGRDRRYKTLYYFTNEPTQEARTLLAGHPVVIERQPPEQLRPAQIGLLLDERADPLDVTATIIDLAVRGYLRIEEGSRKTLGFLDMGGKEWIFVQLDKDKAELLPYEEKLLEGLFQDGSPAAFSDLKTKFSSYLDEAQDLLYVDGQARNYFPQRPDKVRAFWRVRGALGLGIGLALVVGLGMAFGGGLIALPVALGGLVMLGLAGSLPSRTARGREMLRRTLGFRQYLTAAETERQRYNEQAGIFASYLPYAIVFGCVDKWATALEGMGGTEDLYRAWYIGSGPLNPAFFSRSLQGMSIEMSSMITSTPGGSGGSGFSGGGFSGSGGSW